MPESETKPLPQWLKITLHTTILLVTGLAGLSQLPSVATSLGLSDVARELTLAVAGAGWVCTYLLKSPIVLGWLSLHDPEDVAVLERLGLDVQLSDFLTLAPDMDFERIVMSSPWSGGQIYQHVNRALEYWLADGGKLVALAPVDFDVNRLDAGCQDVDFDRRHYVDLTRFVDGDIVKTDGTKIETSLLIIDKV